MSGQRLIETRLQDALHDVASATVPDSLVPPGLEPVVAKQSRHGRFAAGALVAAAVVAVALIGVGVRSHDAAHPPPADHPSPVIGGFCDNFVLSGCLRPNYQPLWPYTSYTQAARYQATAPGPSQAWRHSPIAVGRRYLAALGYAGITLAGRDPAPSAYAVVADYNMIDRSHHVVGLLTLEEYGNVSGAPWEVIGYPTVAHPQRYFALDSPQRGTTVQSTLTVRGQHAIPGAIVRIRTLSVTTVLDTVRVRSDSTGNWTATLSTASRGVTTVAADSQGTRSQPRRLTIIGFDHQ